MARPRLEVADIVRRHGAAFVAARGAHLATAELRVLHDLASCRTAARGGHVERCDRCGQERIAYNSCRSRHCPKCRESAAPSWMAARERELLPVEYFHLVFTLPHELSPLALTNRALVYGLLFRAAAETLLQVAADPKHLGAEIGFLAVLHTWGQSLEFHPHVHCVIPGGGLASHPSRWVSSRAGFFLPIRILRRVFRGKVLSFLRHAFREGRLRLPQSLSHLEEPAEFRAFLSPLYRKEWFVYAKPPFGGPRHVLRYLARYTHRIAISNRRLVALHDGEVSFTWKDYAHGCRRRVMTLRASEFLRRFLLHLLPKNFVRIRYYGFLSNPRRKATIVQCRDLLAQPPAPASPVPQAATTPSLPPCPRCHEGRMVLIETLSPIPWSRKVPAGFDTS